MNVPILLHNKTLSFQASTNMGTLRSWAVLALCLLWSNLSLFAQPVKLGVPLVDSVFTKFYQSGSLKGTVTVEGTDVPLNGASIVLSDQPYDTAGTPAGMAIVNLSDSAGSFSYSLIPEGQYYLEADCPGYFSYSESVWIQSDDQTVVDIKLIPDYSNPSRHTTGSVEFEITDKSTGEPIDAAEISFDELHRSVETDSEGVRFVHLLPPSCYHLHLSADGYADRVGDSVVVRAGMSTPFAAELVGLDITRNDLLCREPHHRPYPVSILDPGSFGTITGNVIDMDVGWLLTNVSVFLAPYGLVADADSTGTFTFHGLRPGIYCATVRISGYYRTTQHEIYVPPGRTVRVNVPVHTLPYSVGQ